MATFKGIVREICNIIKKRCIPDDFFEAIKGKHFVIIKNGEIYNVFSDPSSASGEREIFVGKFLGTVKDNTLFFDKGLSNKDAIGTIFHEAFHLDHDIPARYSLGDSNSIDKAESIRFQNEILAYSETSLLMYDLGLYNSDPFINRKGQLDEARIATHVVDNYSIPRGKRGSVSPDFKRSKTYFDTVESFSGSDLESAIKAKCLK